MKKTLTRFVSTFGLLLGLAPMLWGASGGANGLAHFGGSGEGADGGAPFLKKMRWPGEKTASPNGVNQTTPAGTFLNSGDPNTFELPETGGAALFTGTFGFRVAVPADATRLEINLTTLTPNVDMDMAVRFGADLFLTSDGQVGGADYTSYTPGTGSESITITPENGLQEGVYFIGFVKLIGFAALARIEATITSPSPIPPIGRKLQPGDLAAFEIPAQPNPVLASGPAGFRIDVPDDATQLAIFVNTNSGANVKIYARQYFDVQLLQTGIVSDWDSPGGSNSESLVITANDGLAGGPVFIALGILNAGIVYNGTIAATVSTVAGNPPAIGLSATQLTFNASVGANPPDQTFTVRNSGGETLNYALMTGQTWLMMEPAMGSSDGEPDTITVSVNIGGLPPGQHMATITVDQTDGDAARTVSVLLNLSGPGPPQIESSVSELTFRLPEGQVDGRTFTVRNSGGSTLNFTVTPNQDWLAVQPASGSSTGGSVQITVGVNSSDLAPGQYEGALVIEDAGNQLSATVNVMLTVLTSAPTPGVSVEMLDFEAQSGGSNPDPKPFSVSNLGVGTLDFTVASSQPWLTVSPASGTVTDGFVTVTATVDISGLGPGSHSAEITVTAANGAPALSPAGSRQAAASATIPVTVFIQGDGGVVPILPDNAVVNAASFVPAGETGHASSPGSIVSIFGQNFLDPMGAETLFIAEDLPLPLVLGGVSVQFDGSPAPLFFASPGQINCQLPSGLTPGEVTVTVRGPLGQVEASAQVANYGPGSFTFAQNGSGQAIATFATGEDAGALVAPRALTANSRPARAGDVITLWFTGMGPVDPPIADGVNSFDGGLLVLRNTTSRPKIILGGVEISDSQILFSGLAPEFVGLYQINLILPEGLPTGDAVSLTVEIGAASSREGVTIALE